VFSSLALAAHVGGLFFFPFGLFLIPLFFILLIVLFATLGRRRWARQGWGHGYGHGHPYFNGAARSAESTLAERFANGDIDEKEYRARLEVLRANNSFTPPTK
jgi:putative membrane protein